VKQAFFDVKEYFNKEISEFSCKRLLFFVSLQSNGKEEHEEV